LGDKALVWETIGNYEGHSVYLVLRGVTSSAELHETESDVQISMRGTATSVVGGELVNPESLARKQQRGTSINGGKRQELSPGDIMHIPPGVPHQLLIDPEEPYMYILIKIDEEPLQ
jgi:mannose-6-phosphate isomerase-like protein (cupin superfamily)